MSNDAVPELKGGWRHGMALRMALEVSRYRLVGAKEFGTERVLVSLVVRFLKHTRIVIIDSLRMLRTYFN